MTKLLIWTQNHPFKTVAFLLAAVFLGAIAATRSLPAGVCGLASVVFIWAITYTVDMRRLVGVAVALALLGAAAPARSAPLIIGGLVIIAAGGLGFVGCKAIKKCNKIGRGRTNGWPDELHFTPAAEPGEYAAYFGDGSEEYCLAARLLPVAPTVFTLTINAESPSNCVTTVTAAVGYEHTQTFSEFREEMAGHGLTVLDSPVPSESYARNLHPCEAEEVPITFNRETKTATVGGGGVLVTVERSLDLATWEPLMWVNVRPGTKLEAQDATVEGAMFYRVTASAVD